MNLVQRKNHKNRDAGFTIIELMIATLVFSTILVILTMGVIYFTNTYRKGVVLSTTQNTARQITDNISQAIQFGGGDVQLVQGVDDAPNVLCVGGKRYTFITGKQVAKATPTSEQVRHALIADKLNATCAASTPIPGFVTDTVVPNAGPRVQELVGQNMRLVTLQVQPIANSEGLFQVSVSVAYGDNDLFEVKSGKPDFTRCASTKGSQFCGTATLVTTVQKRI